MSLERNESEAEAQYLPVSHGVRISTNFSILPLRDVILVVSVLLITKLLCHLFVLGYPVFQINVSGPEDIREIKR